eukprot:6246012-Heterocapsa_arctica.AAC.1
MPEEKFEVGDGPVTRSRWIWATSRARVRTLSGGRLKRGAYDNVESHANGVEDRRGWIEWRVMQEKFQ